jgi:hypothetical protein
MIRLKCSLWVKAEELTLSKCSPLHPQERTALATIGWSELGQRQQLRRVDDFICGHNGTGVVRDIDVESGVHLLIRVIRRGVLAAVTS